MHDIYSSISIIHGLILYKVIDKTIKQNNNLVLVLKNSSQNENAPVPNWFSASNNVIG